VDVIGSIREGFVASDWLTSHGIIPSGQHDISHICETLDDGVFSAVVRSPGILVLYRKWEPEAAVWLLINALKNPLDKNKKSKLPVKFWSKRRTI